MTWVSSPGCSSSPTGPSSLEGLASTGFRTRAFADLFFLHWYLAAFFLTSACRFGLARPSAVGTTETNSKLFVPLGSLPLQLDARLSSDVLLADIPISKDRI